MHGTGVSGWEEPGWLRAARRVDSPNFDARPPGTAVDLLVLHCVSLPPGIYGGSAIEDFFCNRLDCDAHEGFRALRGVRVSAHFLIARDGTLTQFVCASDRAWHAGKSEWEGRSGCNDFSIGIELEGSEFDVFTHAQYESLIPLHASLLAAFPIRATRAHSEIAPGRKTDPGPLFDWSRIERDSRKR